MSTFKLIDDEPAKLSDTSPEGKPSVPTEPQEQTEASKEQEEQSEGPGKIKEIYLRGPIGHAYTEALNMLLSVKDNPDRDIRQESVYQAIQANVLAEEAEGNDNLPPDHKAYVYIFDGSKMSLGDVTAMFDSLVAQKNDRPEAGFVAAVVENAEALLADRAKARGLEQTVLHVESAGYGGRVYYSKSALLGGLVGFLQK